MRLLIVLGAGGHTKQMLRLVDLLDANYEYHYVVADYDQLSAQKITNAGPVYRIVQPRQKRQGETESALTVLRKMPLALMQAWRILSQAAAGCGDRGRTQFTNSHRPGGARTPDPTYLRGNGLES